MDRRCLLLVCCPCVGGCFPPALVVALWKQGPPCGARPPSPLRVSAQEEARAVLDPAGRDVAERDLSGSPPHCARPPPRRQPRQGLVGRRRRRPRRFMGAARSLTPAPLTWAFAALFHCARQVSGTPPLAAYARPRQALDGPASPVGPRGDLNGLLELRRQRALLTSCCAGRTHASGGRRGAAAGTLLVHCCKHGRRSHVAGVACGSSNRGRAVEL